MSTDDAVRAVERDTKLLDLMTVHRQSQDAVIKDLYNDVAELRDELLALSNRLEAVTRAVGGGLHSVKVTP